MFVYRYVRSNFFVFFIYGNNSNDDTHLWEKNNIALTFPDQSIGINIHNTRRPEDRDYRKTEGRWWKKLNERDEKSQEHRLSKFLFIVIVFFFNGFFPFSKYNVQYHFIHRCGILLYARLLRYTYTHTYPRMYTTI